MNVPTTPSVDIWKILFYTRTLYLSQPKQSYTSKLYAKLKRIKIFEVPTHMSEF